MILVLLVWCSWLHYMFHMLRSNMWNMCCIYTVQLVEDQLNSIDTSLFSLDRLLVFILSAALLQTEWIQVVTILIRWVRSTQRIRIVLLLFLLSAKQTTGIVTLIVYTESGSGWLSVYNQHCSSLVEDQRWTMLIVMIHSVCSSAANRMNHYMYYSHVGNYVANMRIVHVRMCPFGHILTCTNVHGVP